MNFDPLDPFAKKKDSKKSLDEVLKKPTSGGGRVKRDAGAEATVALEKEAEVDFLKQDTVKEPPPAPSGLMTPYGASNAFGNSDAAKMRGEP